MYNKLNNNHLYDGFRLQEVYFNCIKPKFKECHIVFTERIVATFDDTDKRYHSRVVVLGYPCIISIKGLTKALALYKDYYNIKNIMPEVGERIKEDIYNLVNKNLFKFLLKYVIQCIFYIFFDEGFCNYSFCLHFNNHWFFRSLRTRDIIKICSIK